jgi:hypothetical protein
MTITCHLRYIVDPYQLPAFEAYGKAWIRLVERFGGKHHGYFMPSEGTSNVALAMFSFPSFAEYETYRKASFKDAECLSVVAENDKHRFIISYERSFFRPVFEDDQGVKRAP